MTETNSFGSVAGYPIPVVNLAINESQAGVSDVNPEVTFLNDDQPWVDSM